jgi:Tol biopolymer transport system component
VYSSVLPDLTGGKIFVSGSQDRGELVRYDVATKQFVPFLDGISATDLSFSRDGKWVVYVSIPDDILWRSRVDGRERIQLTYPPAFPFFPRWSPDGTRIAYTLMDLGKLWKIFLVSSQGGSPEELLTEKLSQVDPTWSPDGTQLAFGRDADTSGETADIRLVELNTRQITVLPGSKGLFSPRWSPDGRYIAAVSIEGSKTLWLYDVRAQKWSPWFTDQDGLTNNQWSADSRYIYYDTLIYNDTASANPSCRRIKVGEHRPEQLFSLKNLRRYIRGYEPWSGQAPDDSRIFLRDESAEDIYALDVGLP